MSGMTQLAGAYDLKGTANGKAPSAVTGTEFGSDGIVYATYADGTRLAAFKIPVAEVKSPDNLEPARRQRLPPIARTPATSRSASPASAASAPSRRARWSSPTSTSAPS